MIEMLKKSILNEASALIHSYNQVKEKTTNEKSGISFEDMLMKKDESRDDEILNVEIKLEDKDDSDVDKKVNKPEANSQKDEMKNKKGVSDDRKNNIEENSTRDKNTVRINHNKENKNDKVNIVVKFNNQELNSELDIRSKEKIKNIIKDMKRGKISEITAEALINQVINTSNISSLVKNSKDKNIKVEINKVKNNEAKSSDAKKSIFSSEKDMVKKEDKGDFVGKAEKKENTAEKPVVKEVLKSDAKSNKTKNQSDDKNISEIKNESKLERLDIKQFTLELNKQNISDEPKKVLADNKETLFSQIAKNTKIALTENSTKFSTMIRPENLGRIDFNMTVKDGKVNGRIILQNQEAADFFKANIEELRAVFQKSNVEMENLEIILAGNRFGENAQSGSRDFSENKAEQIENKIFTKKNIGDFEEVSRANSGNFSKADYSRVNIIA